MIAARSRRENSILASPTKISQSVISYYQGGISKLCFSNKRDENFRFSNGILIILFKSMTVF